jgi:hypothetical protein
MRDVERACPIRIRSMLTDNGEAFTDCPFGLSKRAATEWSSGSTAASRTCYKATIFDQAKSWGQCSIADACLYNQQLPQLALGGKTPLQVIKHWCKIKLKLFKTQP